MTKSNQLKTQTVVIYFLTVPRPGQYATFLTLFLTQQPEPDNQHHAPGPFLQSNIGFDKLLEKLFGTEAIVIVTSPIDNYSQSLLLNSATIG